MVNQKPKSILSGAVLAGGKSSRMGRNKALLRIDGTPLWRRQLSMLKEAGAKPVFIVQAPGQRALTRGVIRDTTRDAGPLAGLHAALVAAQLGSENWGGARCPQCAGLGARQPSVLRSSRSTFERTLPTQITHLAVVAVDMPRIEASWFVRLAKLCRPGVGVIARTADGYEPLAAIYPVEALAPASGHLANGKLSLQLLAAALVRRRRLRVLRVTANQLHMLTNWNLPGDIAQTSTGLPSRSFRKSKAKAGTRRRMSPVTGLETQVPMA